jgi:hypothetical protein
MQQGYRHYCRPINQAASVCVASHIDLCMGSYIHRFSPPYIACRHIHQRQQCSRIRKVQNTAATRLHHGACFKIHEERRARQNILLTFTQEHLLKISYSSRWESVWRLDNEHGAMNVSRDNQDDAITLVRSTQCRTGVEYIIFIKRAGQKLL